MTSVPRSGGSPVMVAHPATVTDMLAVLQLAAGTGRRVKVAGAGHSFNDIAATDGYLLRLNRYGRVLSVDREAGTATVEAGITLDTLTEALAERNLALPVLGDSDRQTIGGAISTGTHGTGGHIRGLASQVVGLDLLAADGSLITATDQQEPEVLAAARVGLGALGIISTVTIRCVPPFNLHAVEAAVHFDEVIEGIDPLIDGNDHLGLCWLPHSDWVQVSRFNRTDRPESGRSPWAHLRDRLGRAGRMPWLLRSLPGRARSETVERSHRVFTNARPSAVAESEFAIPQPSCADALRHIRQLREADRAEPGLSITVRFAAADDVALSPAEGRDTCYVAVRAGRGASYERYFRDIEAILDALGGRPHWGTIHQQTAATLAPRYATWESYAAVRERLDPERRFTNAYLERVLGS